MTNLDANFNLVQFVRDLIRASHVLQSSYNTLMA